MQAPTMIITHSIEEVPISEHPEYGKPRNDWGVIPAHTEEAHEEIGTHGGLVWIEERLIPEDRSGWIPEWEGKSMGDLIEQFPNDMRNPFLGIKFFLRPKITETP